MTTTPIFRLQRRMRQRLTLAAVSKLALDRHEAPPPEPFDVSKHDAIIDMGALLGAALSAGELRAMIEDDDTPAPMLAASVDRVLDSILPDREPDPRIIEATWSWLGPRLEQVLKYGGEPQMLIALTMQAYEPFLPSDVRGPWTWSMSHVPLQGPALQRLLNNCASLPASAAEELAIRLARRAGRQGSTRSELAEAVSILIERAAAGDPYRPRTQTLVECVDALYPDPPPELARHIAGKPWLDVTGARMAETAAVADSEACAHLLACRSAAIDHALLRNPRIAEDAAWWLTIRSLLWSVRQAGCPANADVVRFLVSTGSEDVVLRSPWVWPVLDEETRDAVREPLAVAAREPQHFDVARQIYADGDEETGLRIVEGSQPELAAVFARVVCVQHTTLVSRMLEDPRAFVRRAIMARVAIGLASGDGAGLKAGTADRWIRTGLEDESPSVRAAAARALRSGPMPSPSESARPASKAEWRSILEGSRPAAAPPMTRAATAANAGIDPGQLLESTLGAREIQVLFESEATPAQLFSVVATIVLEKIWRRRSRDWRDALRSAEHQIAKRFAGLHEEALAIGLAVLPWYGEFSRSFVLPLDNVLVRAGGLTPETLGVVADSVRTLEGRSRDEAAAFLAQRLRNKPAERELLEPLIRELVIGPDGNRKSGSTRALGAIYNALESTIPPWAALAIAERAWMVQGADVAAQPVVSDPAVASALLDRQDPDVDRVLMSNPAIEDEHAWRLYCRAAVRREPSPYDRCPASGSVVRFLVDAGDCDRILRSPLIWSKLDVATRDEIWPALARAACLVEHATMTQFVYWHGEEPAGLLIIREAHPELVVRLTHVLDGRHADLIDRLLLHLSPLVRQATLSRLNYLLAEGFPMAPRPMDAERWAAAAQDDPDHFVRVTAARLAEVAADVAEVAALTGARLRS